jgi:hypothetical protein
MQIVLEELESRVCPTSVCNANPTYQTECNYLNNLVPQSAATVTAVQSGAWSNPATWGGRLPGNGDNVWIPNGVTVTVDTQEPGALRSILDNGVLTFAANVNTSLMVNTVVVGTDNNPTDLPEGELDIGTTANPIQSGVTATLTFADLGPQSQLFPNDWQRLSGGLISMGTLNIYGSQVTPWLNMNNAAAGATTLTLAGQPASWKVGDTLLIPGTSPTATQDEQIKIAAIQNNADGTATITLASRLLYAHTATSGQAVQVADENRSVVIQSQDAANQDDAAGYVMEMHNDAASVQYAALLNLGRTNKAVPLNNAKLDANGNLIPSTGTNQVGRYALHFHRDYYPGFTNNDPPIQVVGNFEMGSPGWGYDNHSSNVDFIDNVAFDNFGAAFVDETGNELGSFQNNLAINTPGVPNSVNLLINRSQQQDFGWNGAAFWLTSPSTSVTGNHVWEAQIGYAIYNLGLTQPGLGLTRSWNGNNVGNNPLATFSNDTAGEVAVGVDLQYGGPSADTPDIIDHFTAWDVTGIGIILSYNTNTQLVNDTLLGAPGATVGIQTNPNGYCFNVDVINADVEGFPIGYNSLTMSVGTVQGGYWDDATAINFPPIVAARQVAISGPIKFGPHVETEYSIQSRNLATFLSNPHDIFYANNIFESDQILLPNGRQLYALNQAANYVPFPKSTNLDLPVSWVGLTNAQLWAQDSVAPGGVVVPADASSDPSTNGLIGSAHPSPLIAQLFSRPFGQVGTPYQLQYKTSPSINSQTTVHTNPIPINLQPDWNVLTEVINGTTTSWLVYGNVFSSQSLKDPTVGVSYQQSIVTAPGYTVSYAVTSGTIPLGLIFSTSDSTFTVAGFPLAAGTVTFNLIATDSFGKATTQHYALIVDPQNVSGQVNWTTSDPKYNPSTNTYEATITLTNTGPNTLTGTLMAVLTGLPTNVVVDKLNGVYGVNPYVQVNLPNGQLAAGQSVSFLVRFRNPSKQLIGFSVSTYEKSL